MKQIYFKKYLKGCIKFDNKLFTDLEYKKICWNLYYVLLDNIFTPLHFEMSDLLLDEYFKYHKVKFSL